ncbi:unnamed protein product [Pleuronectes platessa]|uniref:Uncharacterized protein n=1 Tax=Pleuronectes platessa TaxID=8262 RepID=A0A9N7UD17_PLEPL|nr:unnamed protein product [Pleuronectes platessa]
MSQCRKRCRRQLTKVARYFYRFLMGTLTQAPSFSPPPCSLSASQTDCPLEACGIPPPLRNSQWEKDSHSLSSSPSAGSQYDINSPVPSLLSSTPLSSSLRALEHNVLM